ncbi:zinc-binding dehydrogenase [Hyalangium versicolor]|uniref:zinc-binding dehydrogenase n=1 Tax=Hyalangium versicolor TaxID=2861190 RepID=UPI001CCBE703|nr:zinc-binding dehydrogenase [Hyalangium versicolor]
MMASIQAVVVTEGAPAKLALTRVDAPAPAANEALIRVRAISLNRGEVRRSQTAAVGWRPGWDLSGTVEQAAADGSGPPKGSRIVGFMPSGAWAELVAVPSNSLAVLPDEVSFSQAATLPVAGLTALMGIERAGGLLGRSVLITGASGGVGDFAVQLARAAGARVTAHVRSEARAGRLRDIGAHSVAVGENLSAARGPFDLVFDGVGGALLGEALGLLGKDGHAVAYGQTAGPTTTFNLAQFYATGGASLYGFILFHELLRQPAGVGLKRLATMIADGRLQPLIGAEANWTEIGTMAQRLQDRDYPGKAVLQVG